MIPVRSYPFESLIVARNSPTLGGPATLKIDFDGRGRCRP